MNNCPIAGLLYCFKPVHKEDVIWLSNTGKKSEIIILNKDCDDIFLLTRVDNDSFNKNLSTCYFLLNSQTYKLSNISVGTFNLYFEEINNET